MIFLQRFYTYIYIQGVSKHAGITSRCIQHSKIRRKFIHICVCPILFPNYSLFFYCTDYSRTFTKIARSDHLEHKPLNVLLLIF